MCRHGLRSVNIGDGRCRIAQMREARRAMPLGAGEEIALLHGAEGALLLGAVRAYAVPAPRHDG
jgi:hypothetical protein